MSGLFRDRSGATLVEFSLVALPALILLFATFEIGFIYWANQELENATSEAARLVRTGQVQSGNISQAELKAQVCSRTAILVGCGSRLRIDVRSAASFAEIAPPQPLDGGGALKPDGDFTYAPGSGNDVVLVSAFYDWRMLMAGTYIVRAASPARNEPF
jgi:Flp pilus assembly protein TadG